MGANCILLFFLKTFDLDHNTNIYSVEHGMTYGFFQI